MTSSLRLPEEQASALTPWRTSLDGLILTKRSSPPAGGTPVRSGMTHTKAEWRERLLGARRSIDAPARRAASAAVVEGSAHCGRSRTRAPCCVFGHRRRDRPGGAHGAGVARGEGGVPAGERRAPSGLGRRASASPASTPRRRPGHAAAVSSWSCPASPSMQGADAWAVAAATTTGRWPRSDTTSTSPSRASRTTCRWCRSCQHEPWDEPVDVVATERRILVCRAAPGSPASAVLRRCEMSLDATTVVGALALGGIIAVLLESLRRHQMRGHAASAAETARRIVEEARKDADRSRVEARTQATTLAAQARADFERTLDEERRQLMSSRSACRGARSSSSKPQGPRGAGRGAAAPRPGAADARNTARRARGADARVWSTRRARPWSAWLA